MKQIICELKKTDMLKRMIPEIKKDIAISKESSVGVFGVIRILVLRRLDLLIALFKISFMVSQYICALPYYCVQKANRN